MNALKVQFNEFRKTTPKYVQWLLLGAAFLVVLILLFLILGHKNNTVDLKSMEKDAKVELSKDVIDFSSTTIGEMKKDELSITSDIPIRINLVTFPEKVEGLGFDSTCKDSFTTTCLVQIKYTPKLSANKTDINLIVQYHENEEDKITKEKTASITVEAIALPEEPVIIKEEPKPIIKEEPVIIKEEPKPIKEEIIEAIEDIIPDDPIIEPIMEDIILPSEACSDFAFAGYDQSGKQIGWIKPKKGAYYFHPFADKKCEDPTGKYDAITGIIWTLDGKKKIGTDADHIGFRGTSARNLTVPQLNDPVKTGLSLNNGTYGEDAVWIGDLGLDTNEYIRLSTTSDEKYKNFLNTYDAESFKGSASEGESIYSSMPYDRTFILRQFKPIPATIVSEVRADPSVYGCTGAANQQCNQANNYSIPVKATVDRNVFSDDGRTVIIPTGTLLMGYLEGDLPGPYQTIGRMNIKWYQFIRPDGVEFNFPEAGQDPYSADAQGRVGVPGYGSTDYVEQMVMPIITSIVPAAVNMIAPIADTFVNQIDLDNNTVVQSGTVRSSELAKQEVISAWNKVAQKLMVDAINNTTPPFSIAAGTRINVYSPVDIIVTCGDDTDEKNTGKKCAIHEYSKAPRRNWSTLKAKVTKTANNSSWVGQVRSFDMSKYCTTDTKTGKVTINASSGWDKEGYDYRTVLLYCESQNYQAINMAKNEAYAANQKEKGTIAQYNVQNTWDGDAGGWQKDLSNQTYNEQVLGLTYKDDVIENPFATPAQTIVEEIVTCEDGSNPDASGCCTGETFTDMGDGRQCCCPAGEEACFPPIGNEAICPNPE